MISLCWAIKWADSSLPWIRADLWRITLVDFTHGRKRFCCRVEQSPLRTRKSAANPPQVRYGAVDLFFMKKTERVRLSAK